MKQKIKKEQEGCRSNPDPIWRRSWSYQKKEKRRGGDRKEGEAENTT